MKKIIVIADDMTGAAEIAGIAHMAGLSVRILLEEKEYVKHDEDVLVIDSNTRCLSADIAYLKVLEICKKINLTNYLFFKKVDSLLRGQVTTEIAAVFQVLDLKAALIIPCNPSKNRVIRNGLYYVEGIPMDKTEFRNDPVHPRESANVKVLLSNSLQTIKTGRPETKVNVGEILIPDITLLNDIEKAIDNNNNDNILFAGGADFFRMVLIKIMQQTLIKNDYQPSLREGRKHIILGSNSKLSRYSHTPFRQNGFRVHSLPVNALEDDILFFEWKDIILTQLKKGEQLVITGPIEHIYDHKIIERIQTRLVDMAMRIVSYDKDISTLLIEGGETASSFFRQMCIENLEVERVNHEGVVSLHSPKIDYIITIKPGSYSWPDAFFQNQTLQLHHE